MATTSQEYILERKTGANTSEEIKIPATSVVGLADLSTYSATFTGNGTTTKFEITHSLGKNVIIQVFLTNQEFNSEKVDELVLVDTFSKWNKAIINFATAPTTNQSFKVMIMGYLPHIGSLEETDWDTIRTIILNDDATKFFKIGDTKSITSKSGKTYNVRLCDLQSGRYNYPNGGASSAVFEFVECYDVKSDYTWKMNANNSNSGGWKNCAIRNKVIQEILADLPDDMVSVMSDVMVLSGTGGMSTSGTNTTIDKLFLPAQIEIFGENGYSIGREESPLGQFDYYKYNNKASSRIKKPIGMNIAYKWWQRSARSYDSQNYCIIGKDGLYSSDYAMNANCVSPIFAI